MRPQGLLSARSSFFLNEAERAGFDALHPEDGLVDRAMIEGCASRNMLLNVWWYGEQTMPMFNNPETLERMQQLANCGVSSFITPCIAMGIQAQRNKVPCSGEACQQPGKCTLM